ncbi:MAG: DUF6599 family protein [Terriglobia bacterium]
MQVVVRFASTLWILTLGLLAVPPATAQELLPPTLDAWERTETHSFGVEALEQLAGREAPLWREYGATRADRAVYRQGPHSLTVSLMVLRDAAGVYGAFSFLGAGGQPLELGEAGRQTASGWVFYTGRYCVTAVASPTSKPQAALQRLARELAGGISGTSPLPSILAFLPQEGLRANSERYLLGPVALGRLAQLGPGDWLGFAYGTEALWAEYELEGRPASFLLASFPTPQLAADRLREFSQRFNVNGTGDPARPLVYAKRVGPLVGLLVGVESGKTASRLLNQLRYEYELTWDEPSQQPTASAWLGDLANIFIGTGVMLLYALLCGLVFAGLRLLAQHLFPGKVFNRPEDVEIIRLDLRQH